MLQDYHLHTRFSCDCRATMTEMCRADLDHAMAARRGAGFAQLTHYQTRRGKALPLEAR